MIKKPSLLGTILYFFFAYSSAIASTQTVNILTWWGYLDYPWIGPYIKKRCDVTISYDKYFDNQNFISRFKQNPNRYDIIIFEAPSYNIVKTLIPNLTSSDLYKKSKRYNPVIEKHYQGEKYPHNVAYFFESVTGLLWNKENIVVQSGQKLQDILDGTQHSLVVVLDDPLYFYVLAHQDSGINNDLNYKSFAQIFGNNTVIITNSFYHNIYASPSFSLAYQWSGEAINNYELLPIKTQKKLQFSVSPNYSFVSADLVAQLNNRKASSCVATVLASKGFLDRLQNDTYYFSPYTSIENVQKPFFKRLYEDYIKNLPTLKWIKTYPQSFRKALDRKWDLIKLKTTTSIQKNERGSL